MSEGALCIRRHEGHEASSRHDDGIGALQLSASLPACARYTVVDVLVAASANTSTKDMPHDAHMGGQHRCVLLAGLLAVLLAIWLCAFQGLSWRGGRAIPK